jgi:hypothetical protein
MPDPEYHRKQAQLFASLALASRDPAVSERYTALALEQLAKAEEWSRPAAQANLRLAGSGGSDMDRD